MIALIAALSTAAILTGVLALVLSTRVPTQPKKRSRSRIPAMRKKTLTRIGVGLVVGIGAAALTGLTILVILAPLAFVGVPYLLGGGEGKHQIKRLEALESWTRTLTGLSVTGSTIEQALVASYSTAQDEIKGDLQRLIKRIDAGWSTSEALAKFASDLDDPTADFIVAVLTMSTTMRGPGLANALEDLATIVSSEAQARRSIEADRAKPRSTARWVTIIFITGLIGFTLSGYLSPYAASAGGQVILALLLGIFVLLLWWMKRIAKDRPTPRILEESVS